MKYVKSIILAIIALQSCTDQTSYKAVSLFVNETTYLITVTYYKNGIAYKVSEHVIQPKQTKKIYIDHNDGRGRGLVYPSEIAGLDSLVVELIAEGNQSIMDT